MTVRIVAGAFFIIVGAILVVVVPVMLLAGVLALGPKLWDWVKFRVARARRRIPDGTPSKPLSDSERRAFRQLRYRAWRTVSEPERSERRRP